MMENSVVPFPHLWQVLFPHLATVRAVAPTKDSGHGDYMPAPKKHFQIKAVAARTPGAKRRPKDPREAEFNQAFGARLVEAREKRGKTQKEVAAALGIGEHQYKKHEYGQTAFPPYLLSVLPTILDRSTMWFITGH